MTKEELYLAVLVKFGPAQQIDMLVEECGELIAAINRWRRGRTNTLPVIEEIADVEILIEQMRVVFDPEQIDKAKRGKLDRLSGLI